MVMAMVVAWRGWWWWWLRAGVVDMVEVWG